MNRYSYPGALASVFVCIIYLVALGILYRLSCLHLD